MAQQQAIHKFVLGNKEVEGKNAEFWYDHGWYSIVLINGEEKEILYKSRNAQEAYMKWNVYIGRKKERPVRDYAQNDADSHENRNFRDRRRNGAPEDGRGRRNGASEDGRGRRNVTQDESRVRKNRVSDEDRNYSTTKTGSERANGNNRSRNTNIAKNAEERINNNIGQRSSGNIQSVRSNTEKTQSKRSDNSADPHRDFEKRKARARRDWSRRRKEQEGEQK